MSLEIKEKLAGRDNNNSNVSLGIHDLVTNNCPEHLLPNGKDIPVLNGQQALSYDPDTGEQFPAKIESFSVRRGVPCYKVTTSGGHSAIIGGNWSLLAYNSSTGKLDHVSPENALGKLLPVVKKREITGDRYTRELGWFYGALISDGWWRNNMIGHSKTCKRKRDYFEHIAREQVHENFVCHTYHERTGVGKNKLGNSVKIHLNGIELAQRVINCVDETLPNKGRRALRKIIPSELLYGGSRCFLLGLLAGLLEGDGSVGWNKTYKNARAYIRYSTSSPRLVEDFRVLGTLLGFRVSVTVTPPRGLSQTAYNLSPSIPDMHILFRELEFVSSRAQEFQNEFIELDEPRNDRDIVPVMVSEAKAAADYLPKARDTPKELKIVYGAFRYTISHGSLSRDGAKKYLDYLPDTMCPELRRQVDNDSIIWERYESVERIISGDVYDLQLEGSEISVLENGLIVPV